MTLHPMTLTADPAHNSVASSADLYSNGAPSDDLEELCHLVVSRRRRLERLLHMQAPPIILRNERRMLRAAVNSLCESARLWA